MKSGRLTEAESVAPDAPSEIDAYGMLVLTRVALWGDLVLVLVKAYIDESGVGGQPRVMLAGLVSRATRWHGFHWHWQKLLKREKIDFSHIVAMENGEPPFEGWDRARCRPFVGAASKIMNEYCDFGITAALSIEDYKAHYRGKLPKAHKDSAYGVCARALMECIVMETVEAFGPETVVNFVFERNDHFEDARRIHAELRDHVPRVAPHLGQIAPGEKNDFGGLQGADLLASLGRRSEPTAKFSTVEKLGSFMTPRSHGRMPVFHIDLHERALEGHRRQANDILREKRWAAKKRRRSRKTAA